MSSPAPSSSGTNVVLRPENISKRFVSGKREVEALKDVSFSINRGRVSGLIGPDGAGKTTFMRLAAGLLLPDNGVMQVLGLDTRKDALEVQARLGYMPQRFGLYEDLSVQENLDLYADLQGVPHPERPEIYDSLMHMTGLGPFGKRLAGRLSGGMKQKLGLACTLVRAPDLLLLDEPTVGVDPVSRRELWEIVYELVEKQSMTVLLSTAYLDEAERCDEVILLHEGRLLGHGKPAKFREEMRGRTYRAYTAGLSKRVLQQRLVYAPGILDAVVQAEGVRLVTENTDTSAEQATSGIDGCEVQTVEPRFEDSFVARLRSQHDVATPQTSAMDSASSPLNPQTDEVVIMVDNLVRRFGNFRAVDGISFEVRRGEIFGLLGANGAGKSTTFRMLCGLLPPSSGELSVAGADLRTASASARERIGYMSQRFSLYGNLSVRQNLNFFARAYGLRKPRLQQQLDWALNRFELGEMADVDSNDLPLGHKQRLALACALLHEPEILFLDEPTSGVDPLMRREFWQRITSLAENGVTIMVTTHFMEEAEYCDRLAIMAQGRILATGSPSDIKARAQGNDPAPPEMEEAFIRLIQAPDSDAREAA